MDEKQAKLLGQLTRLILLLVVIASAPVWVPLGLIILVPTFFVTVGIVATIALGFTTFSALFLGVFGPPLLFSAVVTAMAYIACMTYVKITRKIHSLCVSFYGHLESSKFNLAKLDSILPTSTKRLPMIGRLLTNKEDNEISCCEREQPLYEDESETETIIPHTRQPSMQFPFPKASVPLMDLLADGDEIETFFNSVEELYAVICSLRKKTRNCNAMRSRRTAARRATIS